MQIYKRSSRSYPLEAFAILGAKDFSPNLKPLMQEVGFASTTLLTASLFL